MTSSPLDTRPLSIADLAEFGVDPVRGFLPAVDPAVSLPPEFAAWDELAKALPGLLTERRFRATVADMPELDPSPLTDPSLRERAMLLLCLFGNGYVWEGPEPALTIPARLATPLCRIADTLGRPPIAAHASLVLANWRTTKPGSFQPEDLRLLASFRDLEDEKWFFLITVAIEAVGARSIPAILAAQAAVAAGDAGTVARELETVASAIGDSTRMLLRMYERCQPKVFFDEVRPWVTGWPEPGVIYDQVSSSPRRLIGGSAAQSPLIQAFDAALGVTHPSPASGPFLAEMRNYMAPGHRRFLERVERGPSIAAFSRATDDPATRAAYRLCCDELDQFRKAHLEMAGRYITVQAKGDPTAKGTGGTEFGAFLGAARRETLDARDRVDPPA